jgi:cell fate regulator YaaT (PSP1 superfamily)
MANSYVVRYGLMRQLGEFTARDRQDFARSTPIIVRTERGVEWGEILCEANERTQSYLGATNPAGRILRSVTPEDERTRDEQFRRERGFFDQGKSAISERGMPMQLVDVEQVFGGERVVFYYTSEARVDFRDLVKQLAKTLNTRIEMRQIGIRDEAKLLADYGDCGKPVCCNTHLREMPPVSMKMAKLQKATLDPTKISGRCGRLKCCLRYEYDVYEEHRRELPGVGKFVVTKAGKGRVLAQEILARKILVGYEDNRRIMVDAADVITVIGGGKPAPEPDDSTEHS